MMRTTLLLAALGAAAAAGEIDPARLKMFAPLPAALDSQSNPVTEAKVQLGRMLYYDTRLSKDRKVSCNTCHKLDAYGVDEEPVSTGFQGQKGNRNSPTVYNAAGHFVQFWDGRAPDVEEQAKGPVLNPVEMAMPSAGAVVAVLKSVRGYGPLFRKAFPDEKDPVTFDNMAKAIGAFERKLVTPSRWDKFLSGDQTALTDAEQAGFNKFVDAGCAACHQGAFVGGRMYQKLGLVKPWTHGDDPGRFGVSKQEIDRMVFKVPSLRNIDRTGPYFHSGQIRTLDEAVRTMAEYQTGRSLSDGDVQAIVTWLRALTGPLPADYIKQPPMAE